MKNNELRVGNLILFDDKVVDVTGIAKSGFYFGKHGFAINLLEWFQPIPLTEEWLLKAGFEKVGVNYQKDWILLWTYLKTGEVHFVLNEPNSNKRHITELKFVHQLQNLYFALEGSELDF